ncbi:MAG: hypothetical protein NWE77_07025 [Candidatus Bathyarchaeota archaeon]|nr:hypothetical protein [Candidatus Bathyarchaeota archaeon]
MTEHGFGKATIMSIGPPPHKIVQTFARKISAVPGVIRTHTRIPEEARVKGRPSTGEWKINQIIFEFGHVLTNYADEYPNGHKDFFSRIKDIHVGNHRIKTLEIWFAQESVP